MNDDPTFKHSLNEIDRNLEQIDRMNLRSRRIALACALLNGLAAAACFITFAFRPRWHLIPTGVIACVVAAWCLWGAAAHTKKP